MRQVPIEIKRADAPTITASMRIALSDLGLEQLVVLYPGSRSYDLDERVHVVSLNRLADGSLGAMFRKRPRQLAADAHSRRCGP